MSRHLRARRSRQRGFTLIELIVAVALLAIMTLMAYRGFDGMLRANDKVQAESQRWQAISMFFERLGNDVSQTAHRPVRATDDTQLPEWLGRIVLRPDNGVAMDPNYADLEFTRKSPAGSNEIRLGYRLRNSQIELLLWRFLDRAPQSTPDIHPLLDHVQSLRFRYLDNAGAWQENWPPTGGQQPLPRALAAELTLAEGIVVQRTFALP